MIQRDWSDPRSQNLCLCFGDFSLHLYRLHRVALRCSRCFGLHSKPTSCAVDVEIDHNFQPSETVLTTSLPVNEDRVVVTDFSSQSLHSTSLTYKQRSTSISIDVRMCVTRRRTLRYIGMTLFSNKRLPLKRARASQLYPGKTPAMQLRHDPHVSEMYHNSIRTCVEY